MKKRTMKKWIPKNTCYCYKYNKYGKKYICKWLIHNMKKEYQISGYCKYLKEGDWFLNGTNLLFDHCKECTVSDNFN